MHKCVDARLCAGSEAAERQAQLSTERGKLFEDPDIAAYRVQNSGRLDQTIWRDDRSGRDAYFFRAGLPDRQTENFVGNERVQRIRTIDSMTQIERRREAHADPALPALAHWVDPAPQWMRREAPEMAETLRKSRLHSAGCHCFCRAGASHGRLDSSVAQTCADISIDGQSNNSRGNREDNDVAVVTLSTLRQNAAAAGPLRLIGLQQPSPTVVVSRSAACQVASINGSRQSTVHSTEV